MGRVNALMDHLAPDTINNLVCAAKQRIEDANRLIEQDRFLAALYFFGYSVEMNLCAAYYRNAGFSPNKAIDRDTRRRHMAKARQLKLMESDPHPLVGWTRFLEWRRSINKELTSREAQLLKEAISRAEMAYKHWRPELRYKTTQVSRDQIQEVRRAAIWFIENQGDLSGRD
jgi:hypothetical protein